MQDPLVLPATDEWLHQKFASSIASALHTVSQPLTLVQCALELLGIPGEDAEEQTANITLATEQVQRVIQVLEYMRALTRAYRAPVTNETCSILKVSVGVVDDLRPVFEDGQKKITVHSSLAKDVCALVAPTSLHEELFRLLTLVERLTKASAEVRVDLFEEDGFAVIRIEGGDSISTADNVGTVVRAFTVDQLLTLTEAFFASCQGSFTVQKSPLALAGRLPFRIVKDDRQLLENDSLEALPEVS